MAGCLCQRILLDQTWFKASASIFVDGCLVYFGNCGPIYTLHILRGITEAYCMAGPDSNVAQRTLGDQWNVHTSDHELSDRDPPHNSPAWEQPASMNPLTQPVLPSSPCEQQRCTVLPV